MSKIEALKHPIDTLRTAPYGFFLMTMGSALTPVSTVDLVQDPNIYSAIATTSGTAVLATSGIIVARQFGLRRRAEEEVATGFSKDFFKRTTLTWCGRQTVRTALRHTSYLPEYESVCSEQKSTSQLTWLPHI